VVFLRLFLWLCWVVFFFVWGAWGGVFFGGLVGGFLTPSSCSLVVWGLGLVVLFFGSCFGFLRPVSRSARGRLAPRVEKFPTSGRMMHLRSIMSTFFRFSRGGESVVQYLLSTPLACTLSPSAMAPLIRRVSFWVSRAVYLLRPLSLPPREISSGW